MHLVRIVTRTVRQKITGSHRVSGLVTVVQLKANLHAGAGVRMRWQMQATHLSVEHSPVNFGSFRPVWRRGCRAWWPLLARYRGWIVHRVPNARAHPCDARVSHKAPDERKHTRMCHNLVEHRCVRQDIGALPSARLSNRPTIAAHAID